MASKRDFRYNFFKEYEYLDNVKLYINNIDNFYSSMLGMDLLKGYIMIK